MTPRRRPGQAPHLRLIVLSSDEESSPVIETRTPQASARRHAPVIPGDDVIDLTLSSPESSDVEPPGLPPTKPTTSSKKSGKGIASKTTHSPHSYAKEPDEMLPLFLDDSESEREDSREPERASEQEEVPYDLFPADDGTILVL